MGKDNTALKRQVTRFLTSLRLPLMSLFLYLQPTFERIHLGSRSH